MIQPSDTALNFDATVPAQLGEMLVERGLLTARQIQQALEYQHICLALQRGIVCADLCIPARGKQTVDQLRE